MDIGNGVVRSNSPTLFKKKWEWGFFRVNQGLDTRSHQVSELD